MDIFRDKVRFDGPFAAAFDKPQRPTPSNPALTNVVSRSYLEQMNLTEVRLTAREKEGIREAVDAASAKAGVTWKRISLFGSRVDPSARGGDIDLYVEIDASPGGDSQAFPRALRLELQDRLGERKIDLLVDDGRTDLGVFGEIVRQTKVDLWTKG